MVNTRKNIQRTGKVSLVVWNKEWEENTVGYELQGTAELFSEGEWYDKIKSIPENEEEPCKAAIVVTITKTKKLT